MDNSNYAAIAGQIASSNRLKVLTNNTANAGSPGFKEDITIFQSHLHENVHEIDSLPDDVKTFTNHKQGSLELTNSSFDLAIMGKGFFMVQTPNGVRYTRNGRFTTDADGILTTSVGYPVLGMGGEEVVFEPADPEPNIMANGDVVVNGELRGTIAVVDFQNQDLLRKDEDSNFITTEEPEPAAPFKIKQGMIESSNVSSVNSMVELMEVTKRFNHNLEMANLNRNMLDRAYKAFARQD